MKTSATAILFILLSSIIFTVQSYAQSLEEIQKKIKGSGFSEEELRKKAEEAGYTTEDLNRLRQASAQKEAATQTASEQQKVIVTPPAVQRASSFQVQEFIGREGAENLPAFGYNVFNYSPTTFEPSLNVPVPTNYVVGPGDEIVISLWGETQLVHNLTVSKNGDIYIPNVGLVVISGLTLKELKSKLFSVLSQVYASLKSNQLEAKTKLDVTTGKLRSVKVYVLGEINTPGGYTLPAMSSSFTALYYCGGPTLNGSLRNVNVMRGGKNIAVIDLYDYLITGSKSKDVRLEDEDIIYVPPVGKRVALAGNAFRPAIYELKENEKFSDLIKLAGGLKFNAYFDRVHIERIIPFSQRKSYENNILSIDLNFNSVEELTTSKYSFESGDVVNILGVNSLPQNRVTITGSVKKPGVYELYKEGMRISDLIIKADSLLKEAFVEKGILVRTLPSEKKMILNFSVAKAMSNDSENNFVLMNRDEVRIFNQETFFPTHSVEISGEVKSPGIYTRFENMSISELIILAGGITDKASTKNIEITRLDSTSSEIYAQKFIYDLPDEYWKAANSHDFYLKDFDRVLIKPDPLKNFSQTVSITGEVKNPGKYTILYEGEKLKSFLKRAGNFRKTAYKEGIYIVRGSDLFRKSGIKALADSVLLKNKISTLYDRSIVAEYSNRIPIDWEEVLSDSNSIYNIQLKPGDEVVVPKDPQIVTVIGDVGVPSYVPYKEGAGLKYYVKQAGGYTKSSSSGDEIVIGPNGKKWERSGFFLIPDPEILSGSTIIVPAEIKYESDAWPFIRDMFTVLSSTAVVILTVLNLTRR
ncbi:MAG: SLBB domain-containing protein [Bacteroidota bacterium]